MSKPKTPKIKAEIAKREKAYRLDVPPISWQRAKLSGNRFYDGQKADKVKCGLLLLRQHGDEPLFNTACEMFIVFFMPIPASKKKRNKSNYHSTVPDIDNLIKFNLDMIRGVIITDDRILSSIKAFKVYDDGEGPRTEFTIKEL